MRRRRDNKINIFGDESSSSSMIKSKLLGKGSNLLHLTATIAQAFVFYVLLVTIFDPPPVDPTAWQQWTDTSAVQEQTQAKDPIRIPENRFAAVGLAILAIGTAGLSTQALPKGVARITRIWLNRVDPVKKKSPDAVAGYHKDDGKTELHHYHRARNIKTQEFDFFHEIKNNESEE